MFRRARSVIRNGTIGKIRKVVAEYPQSWLADASDTGGKQGEWRMDPAQTGRTNCLGDIGSHIECTVSELTGLRIRKVLAQMNTAVEGRPLDDDDVVLVSYEGGATGVYWSAQHAYGTDNDLYIRVFGDRGSLWWGISDPERVLLFDDKNQKKVLQADPAMENVYGRFRVAPPYTPWDAAVSNLYEQFISCVLNPEKEPDYPTAEDGLKGLRYLEACIASQDSDCRWVEVE